MIIKCPSLTSRSPCPCISLLRIVQVADHNMTRIRLVWTRVWMILSDYFITVGCHPSLKVAMVAVDSLRQLAMKVSYRTLTD
jgi:brefeldin A-inhibited guanine nucleotide-exchange protein